MKKLIKLLKRIMGMVYGKGVFIAKKKFIKEWNLYTNHKFIKNFLIIH